MAEYGLDSMNPSLKTVYTVIFGSCMLSAEMWLLAKEKLVKLSVSPISSTSTWHMKPAYLELHLNHLSFCLWLPLRTLIQMQPHQTLLLQ